MNVSNAAPYSNAAGGGAAQPRIANGQDPNYGMIALATVAATQGASINFNMTTVNGDYNVGAPQNKDGGDESALATKGDIGKLQAAMEEKIEDQATATRGLIWTLTEEKKTDATPTVEEPSLPPAVTEDQSLTDATPTAEEPALPSAATEDQAVFEEDVASGIGNGNNNPPVANVKVNELDGKCNGVKVDGSGCNRRAMIGKRMCHSHLAQDGQV